MLKFNFLGAGAWGLAFANHLLRCDNKIHIYTRNPFKTRELAHHLLKNNTLAQGHSTGPAIASKQTRPAGQAARKE